MWNRIKAQPEKFKRGGLSLNQAERRALVVMAKDFMKKYKGKYVREVVGPKSWVQLGTRLPVFVLTKKGFELAKPRIRREFHTPDNKLSLDPQKKYHNLKEVERLPIRSTDEPHPLI